MRSIRNKRLFSTERRIDPIEHPVKRTGQVIQFVTVAGRPEPYSQIVSRNPFQFFQYLLQRGQYPVGIDLAGDISYDHRHQQQQ